VDAGEYHMHGFGHDLTIRHPAAMPGILDHVLFVTLAALGPLWTARLGYRRLVRATPEQHPRVRLQVYRGAIALQWTLCAALVALWAATQRPWSRLGLAFHWTGGLIGVLVGTALTVTFIVRQRREVLRDDEALAEVLERMRHVEPMLPRSPHEMRVFTLLAVTAGVCEELLYRGFMIQYLASFMSVYLAIALAAVIFGLGHSYQGVRGVALTAIVGAFLGAVYWISGTLFAGMLLHGLMDLHSGHLAYLALRDAGERAALARARERDAWAGAELAAPDPASPADDTRDVRDETEP